MSGPQLVAVWALLALAGFGLPGFFIGWAVGRACLRDALDPGRLAPVDPEVRVVVEADSLPVAGRFPVEPGLTWSEVQVGGDRAAVEVEASTADTVAEIGRWTVAAELADDERVDDQITMQIAPVVSERELADMIRIGERRIPWL